MTTTIPARPWMRADLGANDVGRPIFDADDLLVAILPINLPEAVAELLVIAPDLLFDLVGLLRAVLQQDAAYCAAHGLQFDPDALRDAASEAVATLAHAKHSGLPVDIPGLLDLAEV
jgi:hypothetical protein